MIVALALALVGPTVNMPARTLAWAPAPVANPLKGLVPYEGQGQNLFPHSMEFDYVPWGALMPGENSYRWDRLDALLNRIAARGNHAIFRVYAEYPNKRDGFPRFLTVAGVKTTVWTDGAETNISPDYDDPRVVQAMQRFIAALGQRYDGDPRVGAITAGMLGKWGEWHNWPRSELFASKATQTAILSAFRTAFPRTPILLRYPAGPNDGSYAPNVQQGFGYHDDSFAYATLRSSIPGNEWYFLNLVDRAGAQETWRTAMIGGEIRPEVWGKIFDPVLPPGGQNFDRCVRETHASWLMDSGMFDAENPPSAARKARAEAAVRKMGYELIVSRAAIRSRVLEFDLRNRGTAPFYRDWPLEAALWNTATRSFAARLPLEGSSIRGILPAQARTYSHTLTLPSIPAGRYAVLLRAVNPLANGKPLGFANQDSGRDVAGWVTLGTATVSY